MLCKVLTRSHVALCLSSCNDRIISAYVQGSPMVLLVCNICTNLIASGNIGKEIGANGKNHNTFGTNGTNVTNQWYHWENPEHTQYVKGQRLVYI